MEAKFEVGQRVKRVEDREITGAIVLDVQITPDNIIYHIKYDEGSTEYSDGTGYWPENSLVAE